MINKSYVQNVTKLIYCALAFFRVESDTEENDDLKRVVAVCLAIMLALLLLPGDALAAATYSGSIDDSYSVMLVDQDSGAVLYEQNADAQIAPASTTKIMTCILAIENCKSLDDVVTVDAAGDWSNTTGDFSLLHTLRGEKIVLKDLLYGMMLVSGNDATCAIAVYIAGSVNSFIDMMNAKAQELGMTGTHFANTHGVDKEGHYVTARDMSKLAVYAMQNEVFRNIVDTASYDMPKTNKHAARTVRNSNLLIRSDKSQYYEYATGIKTGTTRNAGDCLVASATKDDMNLICLAYGIDYSQEADRYAVPTALFQWGFETKKTVELATLLQNAGPVQVPVEDASLTDSGGGVLEFSISPESTYVTLDKTLVDGILGGTDSVTTDVAIEGDTLRAPIAKDDVLGTVTYKSASTGEVIYQSSLIAPRDVIRAGTEPNASGATAVETQEPVAPIKIVTAKDSSLVWFWLLVPAALIAFLVFRLLTVNRRKHKRFKTRQPHYSYKIRN
jgi:D-alanyl-D-alanine carboxypeptidase